MAYPVVTSGAIMDKAAALLDDPSKTIYTYTKQLPFLNMALQELQEDFEANNIPVTDTVTSDPINIPSGTTSVGFAPDVPIVNTPYLPSDLVEPKIVWESPEDEDEFTPMERLDFLPRYMEGTEINQLLYFVWQSQELRFLPANADLDIKIDYIRFLFAPFTEVDGSDEISVVNSRSFLEYRTAALVAEFLAENKTRADSLNVNATLALDRVEIIGTKGRQRIQVRRRPFRASYKRQTYM